MKFSTVRSFAMALPDVSEEPHHNFGSFRVQGKIFVTVPPGEEFIHILIPDEKRDEVLELHSSFAAKLLWGSKVVGVRVELAKADTTVVKRLIKDAWEYKAPKRKGA